MRAGQSQSHAQEQSSDDEDENFDKRERTQKSDDLDWFAKLMRQRLPDSLALLHARLTNLVQQYELSLS